MVKESWKTELIKFIAGEALKDCQVSKSSWEQKFSGKNHSNITAEAYIKCDKPLKSRELVVSFKREFSRINEIALQLIREDGSVISKKFKSDILKIKL